MLNQFGRNLAIPTRKHDDRGARPHMGDTEHVNALEQFLVQHGGLALIDGALIGLTRLLARLRDRGESALVDAGQLFIDYVRVERSEIDAYISEPARSSAYLIGALKITELRERAKQALGDTFSLKAFHNVVLHAGVVLVARAQRPFSETAKARRSPEREYS